MTDTEALLRAALPELEALERFLIQQHQPSDKFRNLVSLIALHLYSLDVQRANTLDDEGTPV